jgi:hypothetical protein
MCLCRKRHDRTAPGRAPIPGSAEARNHCVRQRVRSPASLPEASPANPATAAPRTRATATAAGLVPQRGTIAQPGVAQRTPGQGSQREFCTPTGYDRQPRCPTRPPTNRRPPSHVGHDARHRPGDRTPLGYKLALPCDPGCAARPRALRSCPVGAHKAGISLVPRWPSAGSRMLWNHPRRSTCPEKTKKMSAFVAARL